MKTAVCLATAVLLQGSFAVAEPTRVVVRAQANDAKFIGDHMGGVRVKLVDAQTGKLLAEGLIKGGTGDTARIMSAPKVRGMRMTDDTTAAFTATLDLTKPTLVRAEARGPLGKPAAAITVTSTLWLLPGRDVGGDGWVLNFPGLVIEPTATVVNKDTLHLAAKVSLMCGCSIEAGGLWDAANYSVHATLLKRDLPISDAVLAFTGKTGEFDGPMNRPPPGDYVLRFTAADGKSLNTGVVSQPLKIPGPSPAEFSAAQP